MASPGKAQVIFEDDFSIIAEELQGLSYLLEMQSFMVSKRSR